MHSDAGPRRLARRLGKATLAAALALSASSPLFAQDRRWSFQLEPMYLDVHGHDRHVLTIHRVDLDATPETDFQTAVSLDTDAGVAYRAELQYAAGRWAFGLDYFLLLTSQSADEVTASAGGAIDEARFEVPGRTFVSTTPSEVLFYRILEDTDLEMWTIDLYAMRTLSEGPGGSLSLQVGARFADFDNDYHAAVGIDGVEGRRLDASSNYGWMPGPLVGLVGRITAGRSVFQGYLGQSVVFGTAELTSSRSDFQGPFSETADVLYRRTETFHADQDVAIPITEVRLKWIYRLSGLLSLGAGVHSSTWWSVPVPPGVVPIEGGDVSLDENMLVLFGAAGIVRFSF